MSKPIAEGRAERSSANRATTSGFTSWATSGRSDPLDEVAQSSGILGPFDRDRPAIGPGDGHRQGAPGQRARVVEDEPRPDRWLGREPRLERVDGVARDELDPAAGVGDGSGQRARQVARRLDGSARRAAGRAGPSEPGRRQRAGLRPLRPSPRSRARAGGRCPARPVTRQTRPVPREPPTGAGPQPVGRPATWAARIGSSPSADRSASTVSSARSPLSAGSRSMSVRNSYSRNRRMTPSRS